MANLHKHNLDEWMFNYFEGNLSLSDAQYLLSEVDRNAEFKKSFNYWKLTYVQESLPTDASIVSRLQKKDFWEKRGFYISMAIVLLVGLAVLWFVKADKKKKSTSSTINVVQKQQATDTSENPIVTPEPEVVTSPLRAEKKHTIAVPVVSDHAVEETILPTPVVKDSAVSETQKFVAPESTKFAAVDSVVVVEDDTTETINLSNKKSPQKTNATPNTTKTKKSVQQKNKLKLKQTEKIMKTNTNF